MVTRVGVSRGYRRRALRVPADRPRALRVFRDTASLSANPGLWSSIETALASSAWLVLMASPEAARSPWVDREVAWWLENKSPQRLLVVLTEGEFFWGDDSGRGEDASAALSPALRGAFAEEPRWVDLRWLHDVDQVDQSNPRLRECVADVAAAVREVPKDVLVGEHIRQHRRTMRLARGGVSGLVVLLIAAVVAAVVAARQRNQAAPGPPWASRGRVEVPPRGSNCIRSSTSPPIRGRGGPTPYLRLNLMIKAEQATEAHWLQAQPFSLARQATNVVTVCDNLVDSRVTG